MQQSSPKSPNFLRAIQHDRCADIAGMRLQIEANASSIFSTTNFNIIVCESERESDQKPLWTARIVRPDMTEVLLEGRTHRDVCSALYGLLSESARALDSMLGGAGGVVERFRCVERDGKGAVKPTGLGF